MARLWAVAKGWCCPRGGPFYRAAVERRVEAGLRWGKDKAESGGCAGEAAIGQQRHWAEEVELRVVSGIDWPWAVRVWGFRSVGRAKQRPTVGVGRAGGGAGRRRHGGFSGRRVERGWRSRAAAGGKRTRARPAVGQPGVRPVLSKARVGRCGPCPIAVSPGIGCRRAAGGRRPCGARRAGECALARGRRGPLRAASPTSFGRSSLKICNTTSKTLLNKLVQLWTYFKLGLRHWFRL
uniref:Uncharacterized protein n=1 Tax=Setaria viridis TaxID=4556 RepID=A0A4U6V3G3_SETVI|nr:hypothetical protein SEVIR_4G152500v2 [Setaria viridis]